ncbi:MAG: cytochrome C [Mesorhizobium sp.]|nr:MAG: cytochrome C [Mesorhizobium sp.]
MTSHDTRRTKNRRGGRALAPVLLAALVASAPAWAEAAPGATACTGCHGPAALGNSLTVVAEHAPGARLIDGFSKQCDQERETLREVTQWLASVEIGR